MNSISYILVFLGGGLGSVTRFALSSWVKRMWPQDSLSPLVATLCANILATGIVAYLYFIGKPKTAADATVWLLGAVGFSGGLSTFSTFSLETYTLMQEGNWGLAAAYVLASLSTGFLILYILAR